MSEHQLLNADSNGSPAIAVLQSINFSPILTCSKNDGSQWLSILSVVDKVAMVNSRYDGAVHNKTFIGTINFDKTAKVLNNPVTFINTLSDQRPNQGLVYPIVR